MKRHFIGAVILPLLTCAISFGQTNSPKANDESAIRANIAQLEIGWNAKSGAEFAKPFAEDADYIVINGMHAKGQIIISEAHQRIFDTIHKNTNITFTVEQIRFLKPDIALVHIFGTAKTPQDNTALTDNARLTLVLTKNKNKWEIAAPQNTKIQKPGNK